MAASDENIAVVFAASDPCKPWAEQCNDGLDGAEVVNAARFFLLFALDVVGAVVVVICPPLG
jgi:hypothetical protein